MKNNISNSNTPSLNINLKLDLLFIHKFQYLKNNNNSPQDSYLKSNFEKNNYQKNNEDILEYKIFYKNILYYKIYYKKRLNSITIANDNKVTETRYDHYIINKKNCLYDNYLIKNFNIIFNNIKNNQLVRNIFCYLGNRL
jgi:hypothetical protein